MELARARSKGHITVRARLPEGWSGVFRCPDCVQHCKAMGVRPRGNEELLCHVCQQWSKTTPDDVLPQGWAAFLQCARCARTNGCLRGFTRQIRCIDCQTDVYVEYGSTSESESLGSSDTLTDIDVSLQTPSATSSERSAGTPEPTLPTRGSSRPRRAASSGHGHVPR